MPKMLPKVFKEFYHLYLIVSIILLCSCSKSNTNSNYNVSSVDTTNPALLPSGTIVADINGVKSYFDSGAVANLSYSKIDLDTTYSIVISGLSMEPKREFNTIRLRSSRFIYEHY